MPYPGDSKFKYLCEKCAGETPIILHVDKNWQEVIFTVLYNLGWIHKSNSSAVSFFHWNTEICEYIQYFHYFFEPLPELLASPSWRENVRACLESNRNTLFISGGSDLWAMQPRNSASIEQQAFPLCDSSKSSHRHRKTSTMSSQSPSNAQRSNVSITQAQAYPQLFSPKILPLVNAIPLCIPPATGNTVVHNVMQEASSENGTVSLALKDQTTDGVRKELDQVLARMAASQLQSQQPVTAGNNASSIDVQNNPLERQIASRTRFQKKGRTSSNTGSILPTLSNFGSTETTRVSATELPNEEISSPRAITRLSSPTGSTLCNCADFIDNDDPSEYFAPARVPSSRSEPQLVEVLSKKVTTNGHLRYLVVLAQGEPPVWRNASELGWGTIFQDMDRSNEERLGLKQQRVAHKRHIIYPLGRTCHQCHLKHAWYICCNQCGSSFCANCLLKHYTADVDSCLHTYVCLVCRNICQCAACNRRRSGGVPVPRRVLKSSQPNRHRPARKKLVETSSEEEVEITYDDDDLESEENEEDWKLQATLKHLLLMRKMMCFSKSKRVRIFCRYLWLLLLNDLKDYEEKSALQPVALLACHQSNERKELLLQWDNAERQSSHSNSTCFSWENQQYPSLTRDMYGHWVVRVAYSTNPPDFSVLPPEILKPPSSKRARQSLHRPNSRTADYDPDRIVISSPISVRYEPPPIPKAIPLPSWRVLQNNQPTPTEGSSEEDTSDEAYTRRHNLMREMEVALFPPTVVYSDKRKGRKNKSKQTSSKNSPASQVTKPSGKSIPTTDTTSSALPQGGPTTSSKKTPSSHSQDNGADDAFVWFDSEPDAGEEENYSDDDDYSDTGTPCTTTSGSHRPSPNKHQNNSSNHPRSHHKKEAPSLLQDAQTSQYHSSHSRKSHHKKRPEQEEEQQEVEVDEEEGQEQHMEVRVVLKGKQLRPYDVVFNLAVMVPYFLLPSTTIRDLINLVADLLIDLSWCSHKTDYVWALVNAYVSLPYNDKAVLRVVYTGSEWEVGQRTAKLFRFATDLVRGNKVGGIDYVQVVGDGAILISFTSMELTQLALLWNKTGYIFCSFQSHAPAVRPTAALDNEGFAKEVLHLWTMTFPPQARTVELFECLWKNGLNTEPHTSRQKLSMRWHFITKFNRGIGIKTRLEIWCDGKAHPPSPPLIDALNSLYRIVLILTAASTNDGIDYYNSFQHNADFGACGTAIYEQLQRSAQLRKILKHSFVDTDNVVVIHTDDVKPLWRWICHHFPACAKDSQWESLTLCLLCNAYGRLYPGCGICLTHSMLVKSH
ncbi:hypothetical protein Pelo_6302 [Pelomyxa schiedti]|nr:hypothetical protein Pelo_6302 [Pelomyxa schiedti]